MYVFNKKLAKILLAETIVLSASLVGFCMYEFNKQELEFRDKVVSIAENPKEYAAKIEKVKAFYNNRYNTQLAYIDSLVAHKNDNPDSLSNYLEELTFRTEGHRSAQWIYDITR